MTDVTRLIDAQTDAEKHARKLHHDLRVMELNLSHKRKDAEKWLNEVERLITWLEDAHC